MGRHPVIRAHAAKHGPLGLIQFDAHTDSWPDDDPARIDHGTFVYKAVKEPDSSWRERFEFARAASAHAIQHLGNEASLPSLDAVETAQLEFRASRKRASLTT